jgi:hypothetical protein
VSPTQCGSSIWEFNCHKEKVSDMKTDTDPVPFRAASVGSNAVVQEKRKTTVSDDSTKQLEAILAQL